MVREKTVEKKAGKARKIGYQLLASFLFLLEHPKYSVKRKVHLKNWPLESQVNQPSKQ